MQLAWLARLVITRRDEAQSTLALSCRCVMSNRWRAFSVHQLSPNVNSLDTARLQIPTVSVLSPSAIAFESFTECFLAALCHSIRADRHLSSR